MREEETLNPVPVFSGTPYSEQLLRVGVHHEAIGGTSQIPAIPYPTRALNTRRSLLRQERSATFESSYEMLLVTQYRGKA